MLRALFRRLCALPEDLHEVDPASHPRLTSELDVDQSSFSLVRLT